MNVLRRCARLAIAPAEIWVETWRWFAEIDDRGDAVGEVCTMALRVIWCAVTLVLVPFLVVTRMMGM